MKKKDLKKLITLGVLLLVLAGLIVGYFVQKDLNAKKAEEEAKENEQTLTTVFDKGKAIVTGLTFVSEEESLSFSYVNDSWVYDGDNNYPLKQESIASMADAIGIIEAVETVKDVSDDMSQYGLDTPELTVDARFSDGSARTFRFGALNTFNECQYLTISGDENLYMINSDVAYPFATDLDTLYQPESFKLLKDGVSSDEVSSITLNISGTVKEISDVEGIDKLYEEVYSLDLSTWEDYFADSEEMESVYGISVGGDSITVNYTLETEDESGATINVPSTYTVYIGASYETVEEEDAAEDTAAEAETEEEGEKEIFYFYSFDGSKVVYGAEGEIMDEIFSYLAYEPAAEEATTAE